MALTARLNVGLILALTACASRPAPPSRHATTDVDPGRVLTATQVSEDLRQLEETLSTAYAPRVFHTRETWASFRHELASLVRDDLDARGLCNALGGALTRLTQPSLYVTPHDSDARCLGREGTAGGYPYEAPPLGNNLAHGVPAFQVSRTERGPRPIALVAIRRFEPADAPGWGDFDRVLAQGRSAGAVVLDLRGASGSDPTGALQLVEAVTGSASVRPLRGTARPETPEVDALRRAYRALRPEDAPRDHGRWASLVGPEEPPSLPARRRIVRVLVGGGCEEACELLARMLQAYAGATVVGTVGWRRRLQVGEPGLLVLRHSRVRVYLPTAAYLFNEQLGRLTGDRGCWFDRRGWGPPSPTEERREVDYLQGLLAGAREDLAVRARLARWEDTSPAPCASLPTVRRPEDLPPEARERLQGAPGRLDGRSVTVTLDLPLERARAYLLGCPGVTTETGFEREGATFWVRVSGFEALSRLAQSEAVRVVEVQLPQPPPEPN